MTRTLSLYFLVCCALLLAMPARAGTLSICVDIDPPPPSAIKRDSTGHVIIPVSGASVDIVQAAFVHMNQPVQFIGDLPWKRCLSEVEMGRIDFALGVYFDSERSKIYDYSRSYSTLTPQLFYLASNPVNASRPDDLKKYRGCGIYGSSYDHYQIKSAELDLGIDYESLYRKLLAKRCDYFVEELEAVVDSQSGKAFLANPQVMHGNVGWAIPPARHLVTARNSVNTALLPKIDAALEFVIRSGLAEAAWKKYMGDLPFKP